MATKNDRRRPAFKAPAKKSSSSSSSSSSSKSESRAEKGPNWNWEERIALCNTKANRNYAYEAAQLAFHRLIGRVVPSNDGAIHFTHHARWSELDLDKDSYDKNFYWFGYKLKK